MLCLSKLKYVFSNHLHFPLLYQVYMVLCLCTRSTSSYIYVPGIHGSTIALLLVSLLQFPIVGHTSIHLESKPEAISLSYPNSVRAYVLSGTRHPSLLPLVDVRYRLVLIPYTCESVSFSVQSVPFVPLSILVHHSPVSDHSHLVDILKITYSHNQKPSSPEPGTCFIPGTL
jgi:hypothetical protein